MNHDLPEGWDDARIQRIVDEYDKAAAENRLVSSRRYRHRDKTTFVEVPKELLPAVIHLLTAHEDAKARIRLKR